MSDNNVTVIGSAVRDVELRYTPSGAAVANVSVAVNRRWLDKKTQEWQEDVSFLDVVAWRELAENMAETVVKGTRIVVVGRFDQRSWEDSKTGDRRSKIELVADDVRTSLRWATAQVTRNERSDGGGNFPEGSTRTRPAATGGAQDPQVADGGYDPSEEPFVHDASEWWPQVDLGTYPERMLP